MERGPEKLCAYAERKESFSMMDLLMAGTLLINFGLVWLLVKWCWKQTEEQE